MEWSTIKEILVLIVAYFKDVFAFFYPAEDAE